MSDVARVRGQCYHCCCCYLVTFGVGISSSTFQVLLSIEEEFDTEFPGGLNAYYPFFPTSVIFSNVWGEEEADRVVV